MNEGNQTAQAMHIELVSQLRLESLLRELSKKTMVVSDDALNHLQSIGVIPKMARDGCCKPDGGTCCPNARNRFDVNQSPVSNPVIRG